jgi:hypothetical protein
VNTERFVSLVLAAFATVGAFSNKVFFFGQMGGGASNKRMSTWLARSMILVIAALLIWQAFKS